MDIVRTLRLKVRSEANAWLNAAAREVNAMGNWCSVALGKRGKGGAVDEAVKPFIETQAILASSIA